MMQKILITAPMRQDPKIVKEYLEGIKKLKIPIGYEIRLFFVVNDCPEVIPLIYEAGADWIVYDTGTEYQKTHNDHIWTKKLLADMSALRNKTIEYALYQDFDYWFSVDTDIVLDPNTLEKLLEADKDIISEVFWTKSPNGTWWCNSWIFDQCDADGHYTLWMEAPGVYPVGMTGACMLVKRRVLEAGVNYTQIPCIKNALKGEDRHFCIRAACAGFDLYMDTEYPAKHLYTETVYREYMREKQEAGDDVETE